MYLYACVYIDIYVYVYKCRRIPGCRPRLATEIPKKNIAGQGLARQVISASQARASRESLSSWLWTITMVI